MSETSGRSSRKTAADEVFERLHEDIMNLRLSPGTKLSEVEIARQLDVSRQPVREAFIRLHELELLQVRPQKATEVRRISERAIRNARFVRTAVEIEVLREACKRPLGALDKRFERNLTGQRRAIEADRTERFHTLDYEFHRLICCAAEREFAYATIAASKAQASRLCRLSLTDRDELAETLEDHVQLHACIRDGREGRAVRLIRHHLSRLDRIIDSVRREHHEFFEEH